MKKYYISYYGHPTQVVYAYSYEDAYAKANSKVDVRIIEVDGELDLEYWTPNEGRQFYD